MLHEQARTLGMPAPLLAQSRTLEMLVHAAAAGKPELPEELGGWRKAIIGEPLLAALAAMDEES